MQLFSALQSHTCYNTDAGQRSQRSRRGLHLYWRFGIMTLPQKRCTKCGETKLLSDFSRFSPSPDGYRATCKSCRVRPSNSVTTATQKRCWNCKEWKPFDAFGQSRHRPGGVDPKCLECGKAYRQQNAERIATRQHTYHVKNRERLTASSRIRKVRWRLNNPDRHREQRRQTYARHAAEYAERQRPYKREWARRNKDKQLASFHRRRARLRGNGGSYSAAEWRALCDQYDHRCLACGRPEPEIQLTVDHVLPIYRGGSGAIDNIQPLCKPCNSSKGARHIDYR